MSYRSFGWIPSNEEEQLPHLKFENRSNLKSNKLELNMPDVYDQGKIGSCTANAIANLIRYEKKSPIIVTNPVVFFFYNVGVKILPCEKK
jgi:hypothetical protein